MKDSITDNPFVSSRYIALIGDSWGEMLGTDAARYCPRRIGIVLHGGGGDRGIAGEIRDMSVISANAEMAMMPLAEITTAIAIGVEEWAKINPKYRAAFDKIIEARDRIQEAGHLLERARKTS